LLVEMGLIVVVSLALMLAEVEVGLGLLEDRPHQVLLERQA
jgi:hypothetical protein